MSKDQDIDYSGYDRVDLLNFLRLRDRQIKSSTKFWVRASKAAFNGDMRELRNRVDLIEAPFVPIVLSKVKSQQEGETE